MKLHDVTQRMLEKYEDGLVATPTEGMSVSHFNRLLIELARDAGIVDGLPDDLGDCKPGDVIKWTSDIVKHVAAAKAPPDPN